MKSDEQDDPTTAHMEPIKAQYPNRVVDSVEMKVGEKSFHFILTSPTRDERKKYVQEMKAAGQDIEKIEAAIEKAALAQIRWPDRPVVIEIFNNHSGLIQHFADELANLDGSGAEVRSKNF